MKVYFFDWIWEELLFLSLTLRNHIKFIGIKYHTPVFRNCNALNLSSKLRAYLL